MIDNAGARLVRWCLLAALVALGGAAFAAAEDEDFAEMDIEDLMQVSIIKNPTTALTSHIHQKGDWMLGYHCMSMDMGPNRDGASDVSRAEVLANYMITPLRMDMIMHMFHLMYAPSDDATVMLVTNYQDNSMDHVTRMGVGFTTESKASAIPRCSSTGWCRGCPATPGS